MSQQPPVVSIRGLTRGESGALERVARELRSACVEWGVFQIADHGIPQPVLERFEAAMRGLFALPPEEKQRVRRTRNNARGYYDEELTKNRPDWKEVFDYGAPPSADPAAAAHSDGTNQWPASAPELRQPLLDFYEASVRVASGLLRAICLSLELPAGTLDPLFEGHSSFVRLNHYPVCPDPAPHDADRFPERGKLGVHHHTDAGALTVLFQDDVAGLQVWRDGHFVLLEPVPGALAVNLGDLIQVCSNDRYVAPLHRVTANAARERFSAPFFLNPAYDARYAPVPSLMRRDESPRYREISWGHFRDRRSAGDYANYGAEIQISDYRVDAD